MVQQHVEKCIALPIHPYALHPAKLLCDWIFGRKLGKGGRLKDVMVYAAVYVGITVVDTSETGRKCAQVGAVIRAKDARQT